MEILYPKLLVYRKEKFHEVKDVYESLATSQSPSTLFVTCSDSRLSPQEFTLSGPGELFVIRSAGNLIAPYDPKHIPNEALTLEYGIVALNIKEIVVCGHLSCGAMAGIMDVENLNHMPLVKKSLSNFKETHKHELKHIKCADELSRWNVSKQLENIYSYPFVRERVQTGELHMWGWVFDFVTHEVVYKKNFREILELESPMDSVS